MKSFLNKKINMKDEGANVVIEASFVMSIAVVMIAVLINLGFITYEHSLLQATANKTASNIANVYSSICRDPEFGYVNDSNFYKTNLYRYVTNFFTSSSDDRASRKGAWYSLYNIKRNKMMKDEPKNINIDVEGRKGTILLNQVIVTIKSEYSVPLSQIWGGNNKMTFTVTGRSNCIDLLDYFDTVMMVEDDFIKKLDKFTERFTKFINTFDFSSLVN
ncbi:hypothetical protein [uncultured Ruminococcus sp.]|uniref:hypothetical protein n=1 Tax=uncultured Ruminococcus sp. TaxID=165186 RepID=UPI002931531B|nr:hypothetical protein [uncultured Ruminococcus sp.]